MNPRRTLATAGRVLAQLRHDPRTVALMLVVPCVLVGLLAWVFDGTRTFDAIGAPLLGIFPFVVMFLVTSVATLRERSSGTLERLLTMPLGKLDLPLSVATTVDILIEDQLLVEPEPQDTVAVAVKGVSPRGRGDEATCPANREVILTNPGRRIRRAVARLVTQVEVDARR